MQLGFIAVSCKKKKYNELIILHWIVMNGIREISSKICLPGIILKRDIFKFHCYFPITLIYSLIASFTTILPAVTEISM